MEKIWALICFLIVLVTSITSSSIGFKKNLWTGRLDSCYEFRLASSSFLSVLLTSIYINLYCHNALQNLYCMFIKNTSSIVEQISAFVLEPVHGMATDMVCGSLLPEKSFYRHLFFNEWDQNDVFHFCMLLRAHFGIDFAMGVFPSGVDLVQISFKISAEF